MFLLQEELLMPTIEIDWDVFQAITARRPAQAITPNTVLREVFKKDIERLHKMRPKGPSLTKFQGKSQGQEPEAKRSLVTKWISFPHGTRLRGSYLGRIYHAEVDDGSLVVKQLGRNRRFSSLSKAAQAATAEESKNKTVHSGWNFWEYQVPGAHIWRKAKKAKDSGHVDL